MTRARFFADTALPIAAACALALFANAFTPVNTDLGWMLRFGRELFDRGVLPATNFVSFTEPDHPIVMPEWGTCALLFWLHRSAGAAGLIAAKWSLLTLTVIGMAASVWRHCRSPLLRIAVLFSATHFMWIGFELVRSQLFSFVGLSYAIWAGLRGGRLALWLCIPVLAVWANLHGGFPVGLVILGAVCVARLLEQRAGLTPVEVAPAHLLAVPAAAGLATLANPYGWGLLELVLRHSSDPSRKVVREWISVWQVSDLSFWELFSFGVLLATGLFCALTLPRRQLRYWVVLGLAIVLGVSAIRHLRLAPILLAPVVAAALDARKFWSSPRWQRLERLAPVISALALLAFGGMFAGAAGAASRFIDASSPSPANVVAVMRANHLSGNIWNDYDWGGFMQWALPESKVACDGRHTLAYSPELILKSVGLGYSSEDPVALLDRYHADFAVLPSSNPATQALAARCTLLFCDRSACLLSARPEHAGAFRESLKIPVAESTTSDFFQAPGPPPPLTR